MKHLAPEGYYRVTTANDDGYFEASMKCSLDDWHQHRITGTFIGSQQLKLGDLQWFDKQKENKNE